MSKRPTMFFTILWMVLGIESVKADNIYIISWNVSGSVSTMTLTEGTAILPPSSTPICEGRTFMGWTDQTTVSTDGSDFIPITDFGTATEDKTYYAVFAKEVAIAKDTYKATMITNEADIETNGLYIIENLGSVAKNIVLSNALQTTPTYATTGLSGSEEYVWKLVSHQTTEGAFYIQSANNTKQIYNATTADVSLQYMGFGAAYKLTYDGTFWDIQGPDNRSLRYANTTSYAFKAYKTNEDYYPHEIHLYKLSPDDPDITYQNYTTSCSQTVETPIASPDGGTYWGEQTITLSCPTEGAIIRYTTDGTDPTETSAIYNANYPLIALEPFVLKAKAFAEGIEASAVLTATYNIDKGYVTSIAEFITRAPQDTYELRLSSQQEATIIGIDKTNNLIYIQDNSNKGLLIYCRKGTTSTLPSNATVGTKIIGTITGNFTLINQQPELTNAEWAPDVQFIETARPAPIRITTIDQATFDSYTIMLVKIEDVTIANTTTLQKGESTYSFSGTTFAVTTGKLLPETTTHCDITGILAHDSKTCLLLPVFANDIDTKGAQAESPTFSPEGGIDQPNAIEAKQVLITPAANTTITIEENTYSKPFTYNIESAYVELIVVAKRDFYTDNAITIWYKNPDFTDPDTATPSPTTTTQPREKELLKTIHDGQLILIQGERKYNAQGLLLAK